MVTPSQRTSRLKTKVWQSLYGMPLVQKRKESILKILGLDTISVKMKTSEKSNKNIKGRGSSIGQKLASCLTIKLLFTTLILTFGCQ